MSNSGLLEQWPELCRHAPPAPGVTITINAGSPGVTPCVDTWLSPAPNAPLLPESSRPTLTG
jgi:hypothetical protein